MPTLDRRDEVFVLDLGDGRNHINPPWLAEVGAALDEVAASPAPRALVTTASGKFYGLGLDLEWIAGHQDRASELVRGMHELFARMLELAVPTVAAIQGHAMAGGALFALAHDHRVMREDRGYWCLPEIDGRVAFTPGVADLVTARLTPQVAHDAMTSGRLYTGADALETGIVDELASADDLVGRAVAKAEGLASKDPETYGTIKARIYRRTVASLLDAEANHADGEKFRAALVAAGLVEA